MARSTPPIQFNTRQQRLSNPDYSVTTLRSIRPNGGAFAGARVQPVTSRSAFGNALWAMSQPNAIHSAFFMPNFKQLGLKRRSIN